MKNEKGMATAEYAVATVGAAGIAAVLIKIAESEWFAHLIQQIIKEIIGVLV